MRRTPLHRLHLLVLAAFLGLGLSLSAVQAGIMSAQMEVAAMLPEPGSDECADCEGGDDGRVEVGSCLSVCGAAAHALLPSEPVALPSASRASFQTGYLVLGGRSHSPDPGPPRPAILG
jgi:hypothetical protein